jgi:hypothetical protein
MEETHNLNNTLLNANVRIVYFYMRKLLSCDVYECVSLVPADAKENKQQRDLLISLKKEFVVTKYFSVLKFLDSHLPTIKL